MEMVRWNEIGQLYRLLDNDAAFTADAAIIEYEGEHVIATLVDDVIFGTMQLDNLTTAQVITQILSRQATKNWVLGTCEISRRFSYNWSNENLLAALFSVPNRFDEEYRWEFDTSGYPWIVHLRKLDQTVNPQYYIRKGRNLLEANISSKGREIFTRLYALGYGEGINQLTFASVNGGKPYIDAEPAAIAKYGLISRIWEDLRFEQPQALLDRAKVLLKGYSQPYMSYSVKTADLEKLTGQEIDRAEAGKIVQFDDYKTYITEVERHLQEIGEDTLELANAPEDIASSIADLADRQRINSVYAQGATCLYSQSFNDNADPTHPAVIKFYVPSEARQINKVILTWDIERYRAYETGAESTTAEVRSTTDGGKSTQTSSAGGSSNPTSSAGGGGTSTSTAGGGGQTTSGASSISTTKSNKGNVGKMDSTDPPNDWEGDGSDHTHQYLIELMNHDHEMPHTHNVSFGEHSHSVEMKEHTHSVNIPPHTHKVEIPAHNHQITIPAHTHKIIYGIYEGPRAKSVLLRVDGVNIPLAAGQNVIDVATKLSVDGGGRIRRGTFHTIEIIPDTLTRISATISVQLFIQSEGGGLY